MKRLISMLLMLTMVLFCVPGGVCAVEEEYETENGDTPLCACIPMQGERTIASAPAQVLPESWDEPPAVYTPYTRVPVLMYHEVRDYTGENESLYLSPAHLQEHLDWFEAQGVHTITFRQLYDHWNHGVPLPEKPVLLTFDDGYRSMYTEVFPRLAEKGFVATFFVFPASRWSENFLTADMMREMSEAGMEIGSHTYSHFDLTTLSAADLEDQLVRSRTTLEEILGEDIDFLCYPAGRNNAKVRQAAADCGYLAALTTDYGFASAEQGMFSLKRVRIDKGVTAERLADILSPLNY